MNESIKRGSFIFYRSFYEAIKELNFEQQGKVYSAVFDYAFNGKMPKIKGVEMAVFMLIKPQIDANNLRYENGCKGGRSSPKKDEKTAENETEIKPKQNQKITETKPKDNQTETKPKPNENENENENENVSLSREYNAPARTRNEWETPTLEQVLKICDDLGFERASGTKFFNYYETNGWKQSKDKPVLNWAAALNLWVSRQHEFDKPTAANGKAAKYVERQYTAEEYDSFFDDLDNVDFGGSTDGQNF